jgi:hypothetical protein
MREKKILRKNRERRRRMDGKRRLQRDEVRKNQEQKSK